MKKLEKFLEESSFLKTLTIATIIFTISAYIFIYIVYSHVFELKFFEIKNLYIGMFFGILFGLIFSYAISQHNKNNEFWRYSEVVEDLINKTETREELRKVYENEFAELKKMSLGGAHNYELRRLYTIMNTKVDYLK